MVYYLASLRFVNLTLILYRSVCSKSNHISIEYDRKNIILKILFYNYSTLNNIVANK